METERSKRQKREDERQQDPSRWNRMITRNRETQLLANQDDKRYKLGELFNRHYMTKMEEACNQFPVIDEDCILEHDGRRYIPLHHANELMKELLQKEATCNEGAKSAMIVVLGFHFQDYPSNQVTPVPFQAQQPPQDVVDYMTMIGDARHSLRQKLETASVSINSRPPSRLGARPGMVMNVSVLGGLGLAATVTGEVNQWHRNSEPTMEP